MTVDINGLGRIIRDVGFPIALAAYLLFRLDGQMLHLMRTTDEVNVRLLVLLSERMPHVPKR